MIDTESSPRDGFEAIPRNKVYQEVARQLERRITQELKPGDRLPPERQLVQMLGVSRGSVRDAIRTLELMGLLEPRQGIGTVVCDPERCQSSGYGAHGEAEADCGTARCPQDHRAALAGRASRHASAVELAEMEQILQRQAVKIHRGDPAIEEDSEFHYAIALAADNSVVLKVVDILMDLLRETRERSLQVEGRQAKSLAGHRRILSALKRGDPAAAEAAMGRHLQEIEDIVLNEL